MIIKLSPRFSEETVRLEKCGDILYINEECFDFRYVPEGAVLPASAIDSDLVMGDVTRIMGELVITIVLLHSVDASVAAKYPVDIVNPPDGCVELPT